MMEVNFACVPAPDAASNEDHVVATPGLVALVFRATIASGQPSPTDETAACDWWPPQKIADEMAETFSVRVLDALRDDGPAIRAHDGTHLFDPASAAYP